MPGADLLSALGPLVVKEFVEPAWCAKLLEELQAAARTPAEVTDRTRDYVDARFRSTSEVQAPAVAAELVRARLHDLRPEMERHFGMALEGCERPQFLAYREGDFFVPHDDASRDPAAAEYLRARKITVVVFLNRQTTQPAAGCYCGGSLVLYGLLADPRLRDYGVPVAAEPGLLVAFPAATKHEVTPIAYGERYVIVSWFF